MGFLTINSLTISINVLLITMEPIALRSLLESLKDIDEVEIYTESRFYSGKIDDVMIKDPFCEAYFPKRNGVHYKHNGEDLYFCSEDCKAKFIEMKK